MSNQSTFYVEGVKVAMARMGLVKTALGLPGSLIGGQALRGAARGALAGGAMGGIGGAVSAPEGQGWEGFKRGLGAGAVTGGLAGGLKRGLSTKAFTQAPENAAYMQRAESAVGRHANNPEALKRVGGAITRDVNRQVTRGGITGGAFGGLGGVMSGLSTPKQSIVDQAREQLGL